MTKRRNKIGSTHGKLEDVIFRFDVSGETVLALHNALSFVLKENDKYTAEVDDCETCIEAMIAFRRHMAHIVDNAPAYALKQKKN